MTQLVQVFGLGIDGEVKQSLDRFSFIINKWKYLHQLANKELNAMLHLLYTDLHRVDCFYNIKDCERTNDVHLILSRKHCKTHCETRLWCVYFIPFRVFSLEMHFLLVLKFIVLSERKRLQAHSLETKKVTTLYTRVASTCRSTCISLLMALERKKN
jgi:hypothetical protein